MADVRRIFVEKKPGFDVEAKDILSDLRENLNLKSLTDVRIINRYDVEGITDAGLKSGDEFIYKGYVLQYTLILY